MMASISTFLFALAASTTERTTAELPSECAMSTFCLPACTIKRCIRIDDTLVHQNQKYRKYNLAGSVVDSMVPLSHESYGRLVQAASQLLNELGILASSSGAVGKLSLIHISEPTRPY